MNPSTNATFTQAAKDTTKRKKRSRPAPFPVRFSADERAYLERRAGNRPLGSYIRSKLLGDAEAPRNPARKATIDRAALAQMLGFLGKSEQVSCLFLLLAAAEAERVNMAEAERVALQDACTDVREMRSLLIDALGLKSGGGL